MTAGPLPDYDYAPMPGDRVTVVDVKQRDALICVGQHGRVAGGRAGLYVRFDAGGTADLEGPNAVIVEKEHR